MNNKFNGYVILSDLDGTLLDNNKNVSKENRDAIEYFIDNGGKFSIATGRAIEASEEYIKNVKLDLPTIVYNGGMIYDYNEKRIIREKVLNKDQKQLIKNIEKDYADIAIEIYCDKNVYVYKDCGVSERPATKKLNVIYNLPEDIFDLKWNKVILLGDGKDVDNMILDFRKINIELIKSSSYCCELLPENASKGHALEELMRIFNLDKEKVIAVGDNMNDAELLKSAGIAFCPANASDEVKEYADYITVDNEHHVVKHIIDWIEERI